MTARDAVPLIARVYALCPVGGNLHIVLDDENLNDDDVAFCSRQIDEGGYPGRDSVEQLAADRACCDAFLTLSKTQRGTAIRLYRAMEAIGERPSD